MNNLRQKVFDILEMADIQYDIVEHPPVYTIEEMNNLNIDTKNQVVKNLFVREDKKKRYFLIVLQKDKRIDLKNLRSQINCRPLSFASEEDLQKVLGLTKGAVTPFGIINDDSRIVEVMFDNELLSFEYIGVHPNDNTATAWIRPQDMELIIKNHGNAFSTFDL